MLTVEIVLDGKNYSVSEKRSRENAAWRKRLEKPFGELAGMLENAPEIDLTDGKGLANVVRAASQQLLGSVDLVRELVAEYAPEVAGALDEAYDSEIMDAFAKILGLAYPFGSVVSRLKRGAAAGRTLPNLPGQSGDSGTMS